VKAARVLSLAAVATVAASALAAAPLAAAPAAASGPRVLLVGSYHGIPGQYRSVQAAVLAAHPGDWILVGPGDYKENGYPNEPARGGGAPAPAGVLITTPGIWLRGMNRNAVIIDGTKPGSPPCSSRRSDQVVTKQGRSGIEVYEVDDTWVENLTVCNYLTDPTGSNGGNEIWWNGGQGTGRIHLGSYYGDYLTATSTYSDGVNAPFGDYGIYADNVSGPGLITQTYANNMGDSAYYIGGCPDCNTVLTHAHAEDSALGYSGTNSGGNLIIEDSVFDDNKSGLTSNSQNNSDAPSPQSGACPHGGKGPLGNGICFIIENNVLADNNNPNVPGNSVNGLAGASPVGTGVVLAGDRYTELYRNKFIGNASWGVLMVDLPDPESPPPGIGQNCNGGTYAVPPNNLGQTPICYFQSLANEVVDNSFARNGGYGNPTNGDVALYAVASVDLSSHQVYPGNCFAGNTDPAGFTSDPPAVQQNPAYACGQPNAGNPDPALVFEAECASQLLAQCPYTPAPGLNFPRASASFTLKMPPPQPTMPNPCAGVPVNPWCPGGKGMSVHGAAAGGALTTQASALPRTGSDPLIPIGACACTAAGLAFLRRRRRASSS
jgi:hypothetical protein